MAVAVTDQVSTRERILDAALAAFADRGVEATSLDSLATTIGIRKQTILYWFASKDLLLLGVIDHAVADLGARLSDAALSARPSGPPRPSVSPGRSGPLVSPGRSGPFRSVASRARDRATIATEVAGLSHLSATPASVASRARDRATTASEPAEADLVDRLIAVVDATFRLGSTHPQLLAVVREVARVGPPATTHLVQAVEPLVVAAIAALPADADPARVRSAILAAGARVVGLATEAEVRSDLGLAPDLAWLRSRRRDLIGALIADLT